MAQSSKRRSPAYSRKNIDAGLKHLHAVDPVIGHLIERVGPFTLRLERDRFAMLARSIISQQISTKAARSIRQRVEELLPDRRLTAEQLLRIDPDALRSAGLSPQKTVYLQDLCRHVVDGRLPIRRLGRLADDDVIDRLVQVKGIGYWTAQMFLIFALGRLDVFPHDDLGIRQALRELYALDELPRKQTSRRIAEPWRPYATLASWYCWRLGDLKRNETTFADGYPV